MQALIEYTSQPDVPAEIVAVLADNHAKGLNLASAAHIPTMAINRSDFPTKSKFEGALAEQIDKLNVDIICLAGFMSVLSADFCKRYFGKIINIHPSLLPSYKGLDTHRRAISDQVTMHGCSVHVVTAIIDDGPLLAQKAVPVFSDDTVKDLSARVLKQEHIIYPMVIGALASGLLRLEDENKQIKPVIKSGILPGVIADQSHMTWPITDN